MDIKALVNELAGLNVKATAIIDEFKGKPFPAEKRTELDAMMTRRKEVQAEIEALRQDEERIADVKNLSDFLNQPQYKVPRGAGNGDSDTKTALLAAGWEIKNGIILAPTSFGKPVEMFGEEVLFGDIPTGDPESAAFFKATRAIMQPGYREAYLKYLRFAVKSRSESMAFNMLKADEQKALSEGSDSAGGFLVPPDVQAEILVRLPQMAVMRKYARVQTTSRDVLRWPRVLPHATSGSIFSSAFVGGWAGETPAFTETDPVFGLFDIPIKKIRVATKLSNDFVADSATNVLAFLARNGAENMALVEDQGFIAGSGAGLEPRGILNSGASTTNISGTTADEVTNTTSDAGSSPKLVDLVYSVPSQYVGQATWLMRRSVEGQIRKLVDFQGRFLWPPMAGSAFGPTPRELMGYPLDNSEFVPAGGTDGNKVAVFGDLSAYVIAQRAQISTVVLRERFADTDQIGIILFERVGGDTWNVDALRIGIV